MSASERLYGIKVTADWIHIRGIELRGVQQILTDVNESWCIRVENGNNNIFENLTIHSNEGPGLFIVDRSNNLVLNCDSFNNHDPDKGGENADGFGCHTPGIRNIFRGCRAWYNSDDGFDFLDSPGACVVEYSFALNNGCDVDGDGNGFKGGGFGPFATQTQRNNPAHHIIRYCVAYGNRSQGFYANNHTGGCDWINNTAFDNGDNFDMADDDAGADHYLKNNIAFGLGGTLVNAPAVIDEAFNSWNLAVTVSEEDFQSLNEEEPEVDRLSDGSLPDMGF